MFQFYFVKDLKLDFSHTPPPHTPPPTEKSFLRPCTNETINLNSDAFIANFKHISHFVLVFLLLTLSMKLPAGNKQ